MPWLTIIVWLISFLMAGGTKSGQAGKAALIATGTAAATYFLAEPTNKDAVFGDTTRSMFGYTPSTDPAVTNSDGVSRSATPVQSIGSQALSTTGDVLKSWGPTGTLGVVAGTAAVTGSGVFSFLKDVPMWVWIGGGALLLLKD